MITTLRGRSSAAYRQVAGWYREVYEACPDADLAKHVLRYIRTAAAYDICARMQYLKQSPMDAGRAVINERIPALGGDGGAIVLSAEGVAATPFNTQGMYRGWIGRDGVPHVAIFDDETLPLPGE